ncbi:hypothetical protein [Euzebya tangerina]|uniref:hypothetical protein n=1 Tax=Euzebya tangerina TaxID=591198 RepID=UPI000E315050|nr:hypothetical protein [Euzebya tangerina]
MTVTAQNRYLDVAATHPTPTGGQPTVFAIDVERRQNTRGIWTDLAGTPDSVDTIAENADPDATISDYRTAPHRTYEYRITAYGDNGTAITTPWTS